MDAFKAYAIKREESIAEVLASFPVNFALLHSDKDLFVAYYNPQHQLIVATRPCTGETWTYRELPVQIGWDSHNYISMAFDANGFIHLSANMHVVPLIYFISDKPYSIDAWTQQKNLIGNLEDRCTYPLFLNTAAGDLIFHYRDGSSGNGSEIYNIYNHQQCSWKRLLEHPLTDGLHQMNAYAHGPIAGPDNWYYVCWVWRDNPSADTNHDLSFVKSPDLVNWYAADDSKLSLPITPQDTQCVVDPVPNQAGMINGNTHIGFDANQRPFLVYHKFDQNGITQLYCARFADKTWKIHQISNWNYRWEFGGWGSLEFHIRLKDPILIDNQIVISYQHKQHGDGIICLDPESLILIQDHSGQQLYPNELYTVSSMLPNMRMNQIGDYPSRYILLWESMPGNRDKEPENTTVTSNLRLIEFNA